MRRLASRYHVTLVVYAIASLASYVTTQETPSWEDLQQQVEASRAGVEQILDHILRGAGRHETFNRLALLGDRFGSRMSGSDSLEAAIDYAINNLTVEGFTNCIKEPVTVPHWTRGAEFGVIHTDNYNRSMFIMALGTSVGTNGTNITSDVIVVRSFDELTARCAEANGKIVVFNQPWVNYGVSGPYRTRGAAAAATCGAIATLIRSVTGRSIYSPHTGVQDYEAGVRQIPAACIAVEDAEMLQRFQDRGNNISVTINMGCQNYPDATSYNVVAELRGSTYPDETVIFGGHIDTWDVTDGSMDDGGGVMMAWEAISLIKRLGLVPKRTIRLVLWTSEEFGLFGGEEYYNQHQGEVNRTSIIMQADQGSFKPYGIRFTGSGLARSVMEEIVGMLGEINATTVFNGGGDSSDTGWWVDAGVPGSELFNANENYFDYHHTLGDAMTALDADDLDACTAVWATVAYSVANMDVLLPRSGDYIPVTSTAVRQARGGGAYALVCSLLLAAIFWLRL